MCNALTVNKKEIRFCSEFFITGNFNEEEFLFKYFNDYYDEDAAIAYIIEKKGVPRGYFTIGKSYDDSGYNIKTSRMTKQEMIRVLEFVKEEGNNQNQDYINLNVNIDTPFGKILTSLGGKARRHYAWQVKIPKMKYFLGIMSLIILLTNGK